ncbi:MAG: phage terminase large subunit, partial [Nitrososphaeraceae archaeon]|nr:phage terminase large subunit [Nitrososphaeraceae archaeon]
YRRYHRAIISCPPRSGKSFLASLFLAWLIGRNDAAQHILSSYGVVLSKKLYSDAHNYLSNEKFSKVFPEWGGFKDGRRHDFENNGRVLVTSVGGGITGFTAGTLRLYEKEEDWGVGATIIDDPLKGSNSVAALKELEPWWGEQCSTRRTNNWCQLVIATRFSVNDLHGLLMKTDGLYHPKDNPFGWRWLNIPAICEDESTDPLGRENGESHWPSNPIFTIDMLNQQKAAMGSNAFSALYQGTPIAGEGSLVKPHWVIFNEEINRRDLTHIWIAADTAYKEKEESDDSVITVLGTNTHDPSGRIYILEMLGGKFAFPDLKEHVTNMAKYYRSRTVCIEDRASGISLIQMLERQTKLNIEAMKANSSKSVRLQLVLHLFEQGRVIFKNGIWNDMLYDQLTQFPLHPHDDYVDSVVYGLLYYLTHLDADYRKSQGSGTATLTKEIKSQNTLNDYIEKTDLKRVQLPGEEEIKRTPRSNITHSVRANNRRSMWGSSII